jgi:hypothetical protein
MLKNFRAVGGRVPAFEGVIKLRARAGMIVIPAQAGIHCTAAQPTPGQSRSAKRTIESETCRPVDPGLRRDDVATVAGTTIYTGTIGLQLQKRGSKVLRLGRLPLGPRLRGGDEFVCPRFFASATAANYATLDRVAEQ